MTTKTTKEQVKQQMRIIKQGAANLVGEEELEAKRKLPENIKENMNRKIRINILVAITVILYFCFLKLPF